MSYFKKIKEFYSTKEWPNMEAIRTYWTWFSMLQVSLSLVEPLFSNFAWWIRPFIGAIVYALCQIPSLHFVNPYTYYYGWISLPIPIALVYIALYVGISSELYIYFLFVIVAIPMGLIVSKRATLSAEDRPMLVPTFVNMPKHSYVTYFMILINFVMYVNMIITLHIFVPKENFKSSVFCVNSAVDCKQGNNYKEVLDRAMGPFYSSVSIILYNVWRSACATEILMDCEGKTRTFVRNGWKWMEQQPLQTDDSDSDA